MKEYVHWILVVLLAAETVQCTENVLMPIHSLPALVLSSIVEQHVNNVQLGINCIIIYAFPLLLA